MIFTIIVPDIEWLVRLVRDFFALVQKAYPEQEIIFGEVKREEDSNDEQD